MVRIPTNLESIDGSNEHLLDSLQQNINWAITHVSTNTRERLQTLLGVPIGSGLVAPSTPAERANRIKHIATYLGHTDNQTHIRDMANELKVNFIDRLNPVQFVNGDEYDAGTSIEKMRQNVVAAGRSQAPASAAPSATASTAPTTPPTASATPPTAPGTPPVTPTTAPSAPHPTGTGAPAAAASRPPEHKETDAERIARYRRSWNPLLRIHGISLDGRKVLAENKTPIIVGGIVGTLLTPGFIPGVGTAAGAVIGPLGYKIYKSMTGGGGHHEKKDEHHS